MGGIRGKADIRRGRGDRICITSDLLSLEATKPLVDIFVSQTRSHVAIPVKWERVALKG